MGWVEISSRPDQSFPPRRLRAALGGDARPARSGADHARRADGGRALQAAGARGLRRVLRVRERESELY